MGLAVGSLLAAGRPYVVWLDADAFFAHFQTFEPFALKHFDSGFEAIFTDEIHAGIMNAGVFFMRNTPWTRSFLFDLYENYSHPVPNRGGDRDQAAFINWIHDYPSEI